MSVTAGNISSATANNANITFAHTLGTGSDLVLLVMVASDADVGVDSVTWDADGVNESLTQLGEIDAPGDAHSEIWYLVNPSVATGSSEIDVACDSKGQNIAGAITLLGGDTPVDFTSEIGAAAGSSITVPNTTADDLVVDCLRKTGNNPTIGGNQTEIYNLSLGQSRAESAVCYRA